MHINWLTWKSRTGVKGDIFFGFRWQQFWSSMTDLTFSAFSDSAQWGPSCLALFRLLVFSSWLAWQNLFLLFHFPDLDSCFCICMKATLPYGTLRIPIIFSLEKSLQWILSRRRFQNSSVATWKPDLIFSLCSEKRNTWIILIGKVY